MYFIGDLLRNNSWDPGEAVESLARYVAADPSDRSSRLALAENYRRMDRFDDAKSILAPLPDDDPRKIELLARMALDHEGQEEAGRLLCCRPARRSAPGAAPRQTGAGAAGRQGGPGRTFGSRTPPIPRIATRSSDSSPLWNFPATRRPPFRSASTPAGSIG